MTDDRRAPPTGPAAGAGDPAAFHAFERAGWERVAEAYRDAFGPLTSQAIEPLLDAVHAGPGVRLLDVATGPGYVAAAAAQRGATVVGIDFAGAMLAEARRRAPSVRFEAGDAEALAFPGAAFDAVVISFGLLHMGRPDQALAEARRVLRPRGRVGFTVWAPAEVAVGFALVLGAVQRHGRLDVPLPAGPPFFRFGDPQECRRTLLDVGFVDPEVRQIPQVWRLASADALFDAMWSSAVRTGALLRAQEPGALDAIRADVRQAVRAWERDGRIELPMPAVLASAARP
jgi:SAM-dependent methyltransferase